MNPFRTPIAALSAVLLSTACAKGSGFSGDTNPKASPSNKAMGQPSAGGNPNSGNGADGQSSDALDEVRRNRSSNAVRSGSFTAWTEPANPSQYEDYRLFLEVNLPEGTKNYDRTDLSGSITGTDKYLRVIEELDDADEFTFSGTNAILTLSIPGAQSKVKDTIQVSSKLLKQAGLRHQESLVLVFGGPAYNGEKAGEGKGEGKGEGFPVPDPDFNLKGSRGPQ